MLCRRVEINRVGSRRQVRVEEEEQEEKEEAQDGSVDKICAEQAAQKPAQEISLDSAAFSEADAGSLSAQLAALQEHRKQRMSDKRHWETVDSDLAERIAALISERGETQRQWVRKHATAATVRTSQFSVDVLRGFLQEEKNEQQAAQEKAMMGGLRKNRQDLKRRREEELRVIAEKKLRIEQNELMQKQIAAALGSQCSQCSQS